MKKNKLPFQKKLTSFQCTSCQSSFQIITAHKEEIININICSKCHPFYLGQTNLSRNLGPAEKLKNKFTTGKEYINKKNKS